MVNFLQRVVLLLLVVLGLGACKFPELPPLETDGGSDDARSDSASSDGMFDGNIDAPGVLAFDVAYPAEWRFSVAGPVSGFVLVVNKRPNPLALSSFQVSSISDDHPTATVRITSPGAFGAMLPANNAGGALSMLSEQLLVGC